MAFVGFDHLRRLHQPVFCGESEPGNASSFGVGPLLAEQRRRLEVSCCGGSVELGLHTPDEDDVRGPVSEARQVGRGLERHARRLHTRRPLCKRCLRATLRRLTVVTANKRHRLPDTHVGGAEPGPLTTNPSPERWVNAGRSWKPTDEMVEIRPINRQAIIDEH